MRAAQLFICTIYIAFATTFAQNGLPGIMNLFDKLTFKGLGTCGLECIVPDLHLALKDTVNKCSETIQSINLEATELMGQPRNSSEALQIFYDVAIKRQGKTPSRLCGWADRVLDSCAEQLIDKQCQNPSIRAEMKSAMEDLKSYVCSLNPPLLECAVHPMAVANIPQAFGIMQERFGKYFTNLNTPNNDFFASFRNFYVNEIAINNAESIFTAVKDMGNMISNYISQPNLPGDVGCDTAGKAFDKEIDAAIDYIKQTDLLQCVLDTDLWMQAQTCQETMIKAIEDKLRFTPNTTTTPQSNTPYPPGQQPFPMPGPSGGPDPFEAIKQVLESYQVLKEPIIAYQQCTANAIDVVCGKKWTYNMAKEQVSAANSIFSAEQGQTSQYCKNVVLSLQAQSSANHNRMKAYGVAASLFIGFFLAV